MSPPAILLNFIIVVPYTRFCKTESYEVNISVRQKAMKETEKIMSTDRLDFRNSVFDFIASI
jgi:hypothetical protein